MNLKSIIGREAADNLYLQCDAEREWMEFEREIFEYEAREIPVRVRTLKPYSYKKEKGIG
jgi:hypothetical protein